MAEFEGQAPKIESPQESGNLVTPDKEKPKEKEKVDKIL